MVRSEKRNNTGELLQRSTHSYLHLFLAGVWFALLVIRAVVWAVSYLGVWVNEGVGRLLARARFNRLSHASANSRRLLQKMTAWMEQPDSKNHPATGHPQSEKNQAAAEHPVWVRFLRVIAVGALLLIMDDLGSKAFEAESENFNLRAFGYGIASIHKEEATLKALGARTGALEL